MKRMISILIALSITIGYVTLPVAVINNSITRQQIIVEETIDPVRSPAEEIEKILEPVVIQEPGVTEICSPQIEENVIIEEKEVLITIEGTQYPEAKQTWDTLISWGWSAETAAGIIGNMMAEVGGGTLDLSRWNSDKGCGYGLCQWTSGRASGIKYKYGAYPNIEQQLQYMKDELLGENGVRAQVTETERTQILEGQSPEQVAYAFASYFERCGVRYRARRQDYARIAYDYFMANS